MHKILIITLVLLFPFHSMAQQKLAFEPVPVSFVIKNAGFNVNGSFSGLNGFITMSSPAGSLVKIEGTIDANTIHTGIEGRDSHLRKSEYFDVAAFPTIMMTSSLVKHVSGDNYVGTFDLTIKGITQTMEIPFTFSTAGNAYALSGEFTIDRLDFKVGKKNIILSKSVKINIEFRTIGK